jgi:hypothetical protein
MPILISHFGETFRGPCRRSLWSLRGVSFYSLRHQRSTPQRRLPQQQSFRLPTSAGVAFPFCIDTSSHSINHLAFDTFAEPHAYEIAHFVPDFLTFVRTSTLYTRPFTCRGSR